MFLSSGGWQNVTTEWLDFLGAFPDLTYAFKSAMGHAGIADIQNLSLTIDSTKRGFAAWLGTESGKAGEAIANTLMTKVVDEMLDRRYTEIWLSWELAPGNIEPERFRHGLANPIMEARYTIFSLASDWQQRDTNG